MPFSFSKLSAKALLLSCALITSANAAEEFNGAATGVYQDPGLNLNRDFSSSGQVDQIDPFSGGLKMAITDLHLPGNGGLDISVIRNYQSVTNDNGPYSNGHTHRTPFGTGWDIHFGRIWVPASPQGHNYISPSNSNAGCRKTQVASNLNPILELPDGSREVLANGDGSDHAYITKGRWIGRCLPTSQSVNGQGGLIVFSPEGVKYTFNLRGSVSPDKAYIVYFVTRIEDPEGNHLNFNYTPLPANAPLHYTLLESVTSSDGRRIDLNYNDVTHNSVGPRPTLTSIAGGGKTIKYSYIDATWFSGTATQAHYLNKVSYPDGTAWSYTYNDRPNQLNFIPGRFSIATMKSPTGLSTKYTYDHRQMGNDPQEKLNIITRRTINYPAGWAQLEQAWEYQYTKGYAPNNDKTLVIGPDQCVRYEHIGSNTISSAWATNAGLWKIGLLTKKEILDRSGSGCGSVKRSETLTWGSQNISDQNEMRRFGLIVETETRAPLLLKKTIQQDGSTYTTDYTYDSYGQPTQLVESGERNRTTTTSYTRPGGKWILGKVASQAISGVSGNITNSYTSNGKLSQENRFGVITQYGYTGNGDLASQTDANGKITSFSDYHRGVARNITYPDGAIQRRTVNSSGTVASETDPLGRTTTYAYDSMDRLISITPPKGASSKITIGYSFGSSGTTETLTRGSYRRVRLYNPKGELFNQTESGGSAAIVVSAKYSPSGQQTFVSNPNYGSASSLGETFSYDTLGRMTSITHADNSRVAMAYQSGNRVAITDERNNLTTQTYASYGEPGERVLLATTQPGGVVTGLTVDNLGRVTAVAQGGLTRTFNFNTKGFLASETHPETGTTLYTHDLLGNVLTKKVGAAPADSFSYDARYRLLTATYGGSALALNNSYDRAGRLLTQGYAGTTWTLNYDNHDKLTSETLTLTAPARSYTFTYAYNALDGLASITYPSGLVVDYAPDVYGRPTKAGAFASSLAYHPNGALSGLTYSNGRRLTVAQDTQRIRPTERFVGGADIPMQLRYSYDGANNLTQISDLQNSAYNQTMGYDALNRMTSASGVWGGSSYAYNTRGDITSQSIAGRALSYAYDGQGRLSGLSGGLAFGVSYDAKGNVLKARGEYAYDLAGNMTHLCLNQRTDCASTPDQRFAYDGRGRRTLQTLADGEQIITLYGDQGQLLRQDNLLDAGFQEFVFVAGERVAEREQCESVDTDNDGLPNCYEKRFGFDRKDPADGAADADGDGLSNGREYGLGTNPKNKDSDSDGMPDGWEVASGLNPRSAADGGLDPDGDGVPNAVEYATGKLPNVADAPPKVRPNLSPVIDLLLN